MGKRGRPPLRRQPGRAERGLRPAGGRIPQRRLDTAGTGGASDRGGAGPCSRTKKLPPVGPAGRGIDFGGHRYCYSLFS